ncbi:FecR family protein [Aestuariibaculum marinum]|uniref:FecR domain-containing protein n=1 Tax=Aestuariibaculum marinum TaxID=2683592 RepID=A0A8J6Q7K5_9FLAO|nr:FecR family protein [Aestuariibaculum marinum]MBD0824943.1 FecR domain-containing protein [Aestuariibaculum marinum]
MNNTEMNNKFFRRLIERYLEGETTADELKLLVNYYESFQKENEWVEALGPEHVIKERMLVNILEAIKDDEEIKQPKVISIFRSAYVKYAVAASILAFVAIYTFINNGTGSIVQEDAIVNTSIEVGTNKAVLTREDGSNITLEKGEQLAFDNLESNGEELVYTNKEPASKAIAYNYLTIPRGGQFFVKLSDGTQVWLNSESKLKYPVAFVDGEKRMVELLYGEAYFDVSPSTAHKGSKFMVTNNNHEIEVLGTEFNVKAYSNESNITTTLVEGKVNVKYQDEDHILLPNQQSVLDRSNNIITFNEVDVFHEISWKEGIFSFNNKTLKDIMMVLSRWYDFNVEFKNKAVENELFVGTLGKDEKIENILKNLKDLGIINKYEFHEKNISVE